MDNLINNYKIHIHQLSNSIRRFDLIINSNIQIQLMYILELNQVSLIFNYYNQVSSYLSLDIFIQSTFKFVKNIMSFNQYQTLISNFNYRIRSLLLLNQL